MASTGNSFWDQYNQIQEANRQRNTQQQSSTGNPFWDQYNQIQEAIRSSNSQQTAYPVNTRQQTNTQQTTTTDPRYKRKSTKSAEEIRAALLGIPVEDIDPETGNVTTGASQKYDRRTGTNSFVPNEKVEADPNRYTDWQTSQTATVPTPPVYQDAMEPIPSSVPNQQLTFEQLLTLFDKYQNPFRPQDSANVPPKLPPYLSGVLRGDQSMIQYLRNRQEEQSQATFLANLIRNMLGRTNGEIM